MRNLKFDEIIFNSGVCVGVVEDKFVYKRNILCFLANLSNICSIHFIIFNKQYDRAGNMNEVFVWKTGFFKPNENKRAVMEGGGISSGDEQINFCSINSCLCEAC